MSRLDYSKWDHIEISDDEDDTHPNVDTPSLFRWRHQARVERMEERKNEWDTLEKGKQEQKKKMQEVEDRLKKQQLSEVDLKKTLMTKEELEKQEENFRKKEAELNKKDQLTPWNIDTICKDGFSKSIINKKTPASNKEKTEDEMLEEQREFQEKFQKDLKHFGMLSKCEESRRFLQDNTHLICEKSANFLVIWCIDLEVEEKTSLVERVAHQTIVLQFILQLGTQMKTDPRNCYIAFFKRFESLEADYLESFNDELNSFKRRVRERARVRIDEAVKNYEEEQRQREMGPGGLHPADVLETLPLELRECFEKKDIPMLQKAIKDMDPDQAKYHMKRCIDSGLWVPQGAETPANNVIVDSKDQEAGQGSEDGAAYEEVSTSDDKDSTPV